ncbi:MAG: hypothetical protein GY814_19530 [Gammaproteobacteria bacterium]|nr:hypothetical protein [Gammaproteobacteria bacterium]
MNTSKNEKLNTAYARVKHYTLGSLHNTLWQVIINDSLDGEIAAFVDIPSQDCIAIALATGGYIPANFEIREAHNTEMVLQRLNHDVFGLTHGGADDVLMSSMRHSHKQRHNNEDTNK